MNTSERPTLLCFDNDGTLFASHEVANPAIQRSFITFCRSQGLEVTAPTDEDICRLTGKPGPEFYHEILPEPLRARAPEFRELCLEEEVHEVLARGRLYSGVPELLRQLRRDGMRLVLVTNAGEKYIGAVYRRVGYDGFLDAVYHYGKNGRIRKSEMIRAAMNDFGTTGALMIGDRASDLEGAREAGVPFIGCLYGYGAPEEIRGADYLVRDVSELGVLLRTLAGSAPADPISPGADPVSAGPEPLS